MVQENVVYEVVNVSFRSANSPLSAIVAWTTFSFFLHTSTSNLTIPSSQNCSRCICVRILHSLTSDGPRFKNNPKPLIMQTRTLLSILSLLLLGVVGTFADVGADKADVESAAGNVMAARVCVVVIVAYCGFCC